MRPLILSVSIAALLAAAACSDATGTLQGGQPLVANGEGSGGTSSDPCSPTGTPTWQDLYGCYFGPSGKASCGGASCHATPTAAGFSYSGFVCTATAQGCWQGLTQGADGKAPLVPSGGAQDATTTPLWAALQKSTSAGPGLANNMPFGGTYIFTQSDLDRIQAWIQGGAPNN
jgi:hypothetical protein